MSHRAFRRCAALMLAGAGVCVASFSSWFVCLMRGDLTRFHLVLVVVYLIGSCICVTAAYFLAFRTAEARVPRRVEYTELGPAGGPLICPIPSKDLRDAIRQLAEPPQLATMPRVTPRLSSISYDEAWNSAGMPNYLADHLKRLPPGNRAGRYWQQPCIISFDEAWASAGMVDYLTRDRDYGLYESQSERIQRIHMAALDSRRTIDGRCLYGVTVTESERYVDIVLRPMMRERREAVRYAR